jgi:hypothetical protein
MFFAFLHCVPKRPSPRMKRFIILFAVACTAAGARADLTMQQQIVTPDFNGVITMKVKGDKVRLDVNAGQPQALSTILNLNTGETITLVHGQKMFAKTQSPPAKQTKPPGTASRAPVPRPTGQTQKVGEYDTELYTWSKANGVTGTAWVAKSFPDYARIRADLTTLDQSTGADNGTSPELSKLPGMMVRSQVAGGGETLTMALISAKEGPLDDSVFGVPRGYKEVPKLQPLKPVAAPPATQKPSGKSGPTAPAPAAKTATPPAQKLPAW